MPPSVARMLTVPLTRAFRQQLPQAQLSISEGLSSAMQEHLLSGRLDIAVLYNPLMPKTMQDLWGQLGANGSGATGLGPLAAQRIAGVAVWGQLPVGSSVTKGDSLFPRLEETT